MRAAERKRKKKERKKKEEKKSMIIVVPSCLKDADGARTRSDQKISFRGVCNIILVFVITKSNGNTYNLKYYWLKILIFLHSPPC